MCTINADGEFRYIIQWFKDFSELQRDDFTSVLVDYLMQGAGDVYVNGVVNSMSAADLQDRPMSLFQCRIKLFREWTPKWPVEFKHKLKDKIFEIDAKVAEKVMDEYKRHQKPGTGNHAAENGEVNYENEEQHSEMSSSTAALESDQHLIAVLEQETPVDDSDDAADINCIPEPEITPAHVANEVEQAESLFSAPTITRSSAAVTVVANNDDVSSIA